MKRRTKALVSAALALVAALSATAPSVSAQQDEVFLKNGKSKSVRIKSEDFDGIWFTAAGGTAASVIRWDEVDSIAYDNGEAYQSAVDAYDSGRISDTVTQLEALLADAKLRPLLKQGVLYYLGLSHARQGKADQAMADYKALLEAFPKSRYLTAVGTNLLALHLAKDDVAGAARDVEPILGMAKEAGSNEAFKAELMVLRGRLLEEQKKFADAESQYDSAARTPNASPDVISAAQLGLARCAQKGGRPGDAEKRYRELVKADAPNTLLAGAWNGLGDIALEQGSAARDPDGLRVALLAYLRGVVQYVPLSGDPTEEYERSLAGAARSFKAIGELEGNADRKRQFLDRAKQRVDQLAAQYPGSRFLKGL